MAELTFRLWAFRNFLVLFASFGIGNLPHRILCREVDCDPFAHISVPAAWSVAWTIWSQEIIHGPHFGYGYDHRLPE